MPTVLDNVLQADSSAALDDADHLVISSFLSCAGKDTPDVARFYCSIFSATGWKTFTIPCDAVTDLSSIENNHVGNEALRFSAIIRLIVLELDATDIRLVTNHKGLVRGEAKLALLRQNNVGNKPCSYFSIEKDVVKGFTYPARVREAELCGSDDILQFGGFLNLFDQQYFTSSNVSLAFCTAAVKHASVCLKKGR